MNIPARVAGEEDQLFTSAKLIMSLEIVSTILSTAGISVSAPLWEAIRVYLERRGVKRVPLGIQNPEDLREAVGVLQQQENQIPQREAHALTLDALSAAHDAANGLRAERLRQAKITFNAAITLAVLGVLIIFAGVVLLFSHNAITPGALTAAIGAVTEVVSVLLFRINHETNNRLDEIGKNLSSIEAARIAMTLIDKIEDPRKRDDAIRDAAKDLRRNAGTPKTG